MRLQGTFLKSIVAMAAMLTPAVATGTGGSTVATTSWQNITYTIINNTTTPIPEGNDHGVTSEGVMGVSCDATNFNIILKDVTQDIPCYKLPSETHTLTYIAAGQETPSGTVDWNCETGEKMQLTFTGSGTGITYSTPSCISEVATADDPDDD